MGLAVAIGPPELGIVYAELGDFRRGEGDGFGFFGRECDWIVEFYIRKRGVEIAGLGLVRQVLDCGLER